MITWSVMSAIITGHLICIPSIAMLAPLNVTFLPIFKGSVSELANFLFITEMCAAVSTMAFSGFH